MRVVLAWLAMGVLPLSLCLALSYGLSVYHFDRELTSLAKANARRIDTILHDGDAALALLEKATNGECNDATIATMSHAVFQGIYFREAGIERDGNLACTSEGMIAPGFNIENSRRKPAVRIGAMELLSPTKTIQGGKSIILNRPLRPDRTRFINLLIDPQILVDTSRSLEGLEASTFLDDRPNSALFRFDGRSGGGVQARLTVPLDAGLYRNEDEFYAIADSLPFPFYSVVSISRAHVLQHWRTQMQPAVIAGFLLSALAFLILRRFLPRRDATEDLRDGIDAGEIELEYQPIVDARDGRIVAAEALARWHHPSRGRVMPDEFIPLAEQSGLISPLTDRVIARVKSDLGELGELPPGFRIGINLARAQLADSSLLASLDRVFGAGQALDSLSFEITERELLENVVDNARAIVDELSRRGARVSLDDFGTGYSGLSHLRHLKLDHIKIDGSFVRALNTEAVTASLVESIVSLARSLDLGLIAEGVETEVQRDTLLALGVHLQQGWLYAKALTPTQLRERLSTRPASPAVGSS
jgi:sensor c-di-GMP phosphodiesterase-like protein